MQGKRPDSQQHWRDVMPCYLSIQDRDLRILEVNKLFRRDFGSGVGQLCYAVYKNRRTPCPNCPVLKTFADGKDHISEETLIAKNGELYQVVVTSTPMFDSSGEVSTVMEMSTNVTEVKNLRQQLDSSQRYFRQLFDIVPCYITIQDPNFRIVDANDLFRRNFGEPLNRRCFEAYKSRSCICPDCPVEKTFADGKLHASQEKVVASNGREEAVLVQSMPVTNEQGLITAVMEVSTNITEVQDLQRQLAMVGMAVAGTAHRLKNVLMGLEGGVFVVNTGFEDNDQETMQQGWSMIQRNVPKVSRLAKDLLYCSKERTPNYRRDVSPKAIAHEVYDLFKKRAEQNNIDLQIHMGEDDDSGVFDPQALTSLVTNLVANALDACRFDESDLNKRHQITILCGLDGASNVVIEVADNGSGISNEHRHQVFDSFFSSKGTEGTGLGLFVAQKVVQEHHGSITFSSHLGEGTTFQVILPRNPVERDLGN